MDVVKLLIFTFLYSVWIEEEVEEEEGYFMVGSANNRMDNELRCMDSCSPNQVPHASVKIERRYKTAGGREAKQLLLLE